MRASHQHLSKSLTPVQNSVMRTAAPSELTLRRLWRRHNHQEMPRAGDIHPRLIPTCACSLAWPLAGRRGTSLLSQHRSRSNKPPTEDTPVICCSASPPSATSISRKSCRRADRSSPSMLSTIGSAFWSSILNSKEQLHLVLFVDRVAGWTRDWAHSRASLLHSKHGACGDLSGAVLDPLSDVSHVSEWAIIHY